MRVFASMSEPKSTLLERGGKARWVKRANGTASFGYKLHAAVDLGTNIVRHTIVPSAKVVDVDQGHRLVCGDERAVYADKGYAGPRLRDRLARHGTRNRAQRGWQRASTDGPAARPGTTPSSAGDAGASKRCSLIETILAGSKFSPVPPARAGYRNMKVRSSPPPSNPTPSPRTCSGVHSAARRRT